MNIMIKWTIAAGTLALAATATAQETATSKIGFFEPLMLVGFVAIFYFLIWRPQNKRAKAHRDLVASLNKGNEVVTSGGIMGTIVKVEEDLVQLRIADKVEITIQRQAISAVLPKGTLTAK